MDNKKLPECFPYKQIYTYLDDIQLREKIIIENLKMISLSREFIEKLLKCSEIKEEIEI